MGGGNTWASHTFRQTNQLPFLPATLPPPPVSPPSHEVADGLIGAVHVGHRRDELLTLLLELACTRAAVTAAWPHCTAQAGRGGGGDAPSCSSALVLTLPYPLSASLTAERRAMTSRFRASCHFSSSAAGSVPTSRSFDSHSSRRRRARRRFSRMRSPCGPDPHKGVNRCFPCAPGPGAAAPPGVPPWLWQQRRRPTAPATRPAWCASSRSPQPAAPPRTQARPCAPSRRPRPAPPPPARRGRLAARRSAPPRVRRTRRRRRRRCQRARP